MHLFDLNDVSLRHHGAHRDALLGIRFALSAGEQIALIGSSGSGKTTLLHTLALAHRPDAGSVLMFGCEPWRASSRARHKLRARLFLAPQNPPLPPRQRVVNAVLAARLPHWSIWRALASLIRPHDAVAAYTALSAFDLQDKLYARVDRLSGGERQRASLARLLVSTAELFLVDEPLSSLDPTLAKLTLAALQHEARARRAALVCSLHQVELALAHFPRIIGLRDGRIVFDAPRPKVTPTMIADLYRGERPQSSMEDDPPVRSSHVIVPGL